jgi:hypothetical protein
MDPFPCVRISFQEMALLGQSPGHKDAVQTLLEGAKNINVV